MSAALSVVSRSITDVAELERDLQRAKGQLLAVIGAGAVAAVANNDFRREVRRALGEGKLTVEYFEQLEDVLQGELESMSAAAEQFLDEELRAALP